MLTFLFFSSSAQNSWTKDERSNIYNECVGFLGKYVHLSPEQKETVSLCYLDEITKKYNRNDYQNKIEVEVKKIRETTLTLCSKNVGVELAEPKKEEPKVPAKREKTSELKASKQNLVGYWKDDENEFWLFETGDYKMIYQNGKIVKGTWKIDNEQLTLYKEKLLWSSEKVYKILIYTTDKFVYQSLKSKSDTFTATRIK